MMPERQAEKARYDLMPDFYFDGRHGARRSHGDDACRPVRRRSRDADPRPGLGAGRITRELARRGARVTGIDISVSASPT